MHMFVSVVCHDFPAVVPCPKKCGQCYCLKVLWQLMAACVDPSHLICVSHLHMLCLFSTAKVESFQCVCAWHG